MRGSGTTTWIIASLIVPVSFGLGWLVTRLRVAIAMRRLRGAEGESWVERARLAFPARQAVVGNMVLITLTVGGIVSVRVAPESGLAPAAWGVIAGLAAFSGVATAGCQKERRLLRTGDRLAPPGVPLRGFLVFQMLAPYGVMVALIPMRWGWAAVAVLALGMALLTFQIAGGSILVLRRLGLARPASPRLSAVVSRAAERVGVRPRATFELASPGANALAWPVPRFLVFVGPILDVLDDAELEAVTAHELGHLNEPRPVFMTRLTAAYLLVGVAAGIPLAGSFGPAAGLAPIVLLAVAILVMRRVGRRMEERSDRLGREHEGENAGTYARALEKLYEANLMPVVTRSRRPVHPHLYDRLIAAGVTPAYPRPQPPPRDRLGTVVFLTLMTAAWVWLIASVAPIDPGPARRRSWESAVRAQKAFERGDLESAARYYTVASESDTSTPLYAANLAAILLRLGRLDEAESAALRAEAGGVGDEAVSALVRQVRDAIRRHRQSPQEGREEAEDGKPPNRPGPAMRGDSSHPEPAVAAPHRHAHGSHSRGDIGGAGRPRRFPETSPIAARPRPIFLKRDQTSSLVGERRASDAADQIARPEPANPRVFRALHAPRPHRREKRVSAGATGFR